MTEAELRAAAKARSQAVVTRADRPSQRRAAEMPGSRPAVRVRAAMDLRAASSGDTLEFDGIASAYEAGYEMWDFYGPYTEIVTAGAGSDSLARTDLDVPLVLSHDSLRRIARTTNGTLTLDENDDGLHANAPSLDPADGDVAYIAPKIRSKLIDEMSFMFRIEAGQWSPDYMEYRINRYDIHRGDVAIVGYGANPSTSANLRALQSTVGKLQTGRALDPEDVNVLTQMLGQFAAIDSIVDEAQELLASYLQVPSPDSDDDAGVEALSKAGIDVLRQLARDVNREFRSRGVDPPMSLHQLLAL